MAASPIPMPAAELKRALTEVPAICKELGLHNGARVQQQGLLVLCPWHAEKNPSCSVTLAPDGSVRVKCFACGASGDVFALIAQVRGLDVTKQFGAVLAEGRRIAAGATTAGTTTRTEVSDADDADGARARVAKTLLEACPLAAALDASAYLTTRGLLDEAVTDGWGALPEPVEDAVRIINRVIVAHGLEDWQKSGFVTTPGGLTWPDHRVLIPWRDPSGRITTLQRRLVRCAEDEVQKYVFPRGGAATWPYGIETAARVDNPAGIVFVEGAFDVLALRALYKKHAVPRVVVGVPGVANFRRAWAEFAQGRTAFVAFDRDEAGDRAAERVASKLYTAGAARVVRIRPASGKDWAEALLQEAS
ncbi:toprim domain-containing protein [Polyangium spumosum]|uniref:Zinc finger CHC2-type domain-containing protein n=1 Tax=Polyangium spumosum TaxID=889282 RepID=A0A6N7PWL3_9BACT|nr:toprim domain-containing protein [Polyangium spumosum]MRG94635.1 hypothetical protein [Polyangium spumosum]